MAFRKLAVRKNIFGNSENSLSWKDFSWRDFSSVRKNRMLFKKTVVKWKDFDVFGKTICSWKDIYVFGKICPGFTVRIKLQGEGLGYGQGISFRVYDNGQGISFILPNISRCLQLHIFVSRFILSFLTSVLSILKSIFPT